MVCINECGALVCVCRHVGLGVVVWRHGWVAMCMNMVMLEGTAYSGTESIDALLRQEALPAWVQVSSLYTTKNGLWINLYNLTEGLDKVECISEFQIAISPA